MCLPLMRCFALSNIMGAYLKLIVPGQPTVNTVSVSFTSISLSWSVPSGSVVTSYEVEWQRDSSLGCSDDDDGSATITDGSTSYDIAGLEEGQTYSITVRAINSAGIKSPASVIVSTTLIGECDKQTNAVL